MVVLVNRPSSKATSFPLSYGTNLFWVEKLNIFGGKRRFPCVLGGCCPDPAERHTTHPHVPELNLALSRLAFQPWALSKDSGKSINTGKNCRERRVRKGRDGGVHTREQPEIHHTPSPCCPSLNQALVFSFL